ncbi:MAG: SGNH/GDSL hydrolase family protein [Elusimicrobia bacterium]|nr:SGNH/GDSL hydrolase family protein [Elusimicrobiota bacterium]
MLREISKNIFVFMIGSIVSLCCLELFLRLYNPFESRIKGEKIILYKNKKYVIHNKKNLKLDNRIIHTKNSLGFRGEEPPNDFHRYIKIITVGGSTTECFYLSDHNTWPYLLGEKLKSRIKRVWVNNAGFDGHTTFGHLILLEDYLLKLDINVILFLTGINDIGLEHLHQNDQLIINKLQKFENFKFLLKSITFHSEVLTLALNIYRYLRGVGHHAINDLKQLGQREISKDIEDKILKSDKEIYLPLYKKRLNKIIKICRTKQIEPIFITQPILPGKGFDEITKVDLAKIRIDNLNGELLWKRLELLNQTIRDLADENKIFIIDLAKKLPKSSKYYYDFTHFTNEGAQKVSDIIFEDLFPQLLKEEIKKNSKGFNKS